MDPLRSPDDLKRMLRFVRRDPSIPLVAKPGGGYRPMRRKTDLAPGQRVTRTAPPNPGRRATDGR